MDDAGRRRGRTGPVEPFGGAPRLLDRARIAAHQHDIAAFVGRDPRCALGRAEQGLDRLADILRIGARERDRLERHSPTPVERPGQPLDPADIVGIIGDDDRIGAGERLDAAELRHQRPEDARRRLGRDIVEADQARRDLRSGARPADIAYRTGLRHDPPDSSAPHRGIAMDPQHRLEQVPHRLVRQRLGRGDGDLTAHLRIEDQGAAGDARNLVGDRGDVDIVHVDDDIRRAIHRHRRRHLRRHGTGKGDNGQQRLHRVDTDRVSRWPARTISTRAEPAATIG